MAYNNLYPQELWNAIHKEGSAFYLESQDHPIVRKLHEFLPGGPGHAIEIGCCPGRFLGHLGLMGYTVHGLDLSPTLHDTAKALAEAGLPCGQFHEKDFFDFCAKSRRRFAVVASFGFIEHFIEFEKVFTLHCALAKKKGFIVVTFPNYFGVLQYALHSLFDAQGLARHNRDAMRIEPYMKAAAANNCEVLYAGYFGGFRFWRNKSEPLPEDPVLLALHQGIQKLSAQRALTQDAPEWSCLGGIVARKR